MNNTTINNVIQLYKEMLEEIGNLGLENIVPEIFMERIISYNKILLDTLEPYVVNGGHRQLDRYEEVKSGLNRLIILAEKILVRTSNLKDKINYSTYREALAAYVIRQLMIAIGVVEPERLNNRLFN